MLYDGKKFILFYIDDDKVKQYICENKPSIEYKLEVYSHINVELAHIFKESSPDTVKLWLERNHNYINLEVEYV